MRRTLLIVLTIASCIALTFYVYTRFPEPPQAPRYVGQGATEPKSGERLVIAESSNVHTLDPHFAYDTLSIAAVRLLNDTLLDYNQQAELVPSLAVALPEISSDGKTFRFSLRPNLRFHNGKPLDAEAVQWSFYRLLAHDVGSPGAPFFEAIVGASAYHSGEAERIAGIRVIDPLHIEFELKQPDQTFLNAIAMTFAAPMEKTHVHSIEQRLGRDAVGQHPIGSGPFMLQVWERGVELRFRRFEDYWNPMARVDEIFYLENTSAYVASARFRNGDLDVIYGPTKIDALFFRAAAAWRPFLREFPTPSVYGLTLNCELEPFDNIHVRRAVSFAIDRKNLQRLDPTHYIPATQILPPMLPGHDPKLTSAQHFDLERARQEMRAAGRVDGLEEPVELWVRSDGEVRLAQVIQQDLRAIGVAVEIKQVSFATYLKETGKPRVAQMALSGWHQDFPDPSNFMDPLLHSRAIHPENSENRSFYRNKKLDTLLDRARGEIDREQRLAMYRQANEIIAHDAPWAFLFYPIDIFVWQPYVKNFEPHPVWLHEYRNVWIDGPRIRVKERNRLAAVP